MDLKSAWRCDSCKDGNRTIPFNKNFYQYAFITDKTSVMPSTETVASEQRLEWSPSSPWGSIQTGSRLCRWDQTIAKCNRPSFVLRPAPLPDGGINLMEVLSLFGIGCPPATWLRWFATAGQGQVIRFIRARIFVPIKDDIWLAINLSQVLVVIGSICGIQVDGLTLLALCTTCRGYRWPTSSSFLVAPLPL